MDHTLAHPRAGDTILLALDAEDPMRVVFSGQQVIVLDWVDRHTGQVWARWRDGALPLQRSYLHRVSPSTTIDGMDVDVVAVEAIPRGPVFLVHQSELPPAGKSA